MELEKQFLNTVQKYELIKSKEKIILGISGGPDSVCMLYLFSQFRADFKLELICAHLNHCLRREADDDERFVKKICQELNMRFVSERIKVSKFFSGDSLEQTARNLRFDFFLKCARQFKIKKIALAHNKDDVVETTLMRIIRGSALKGLRAILPKSKFRGTTLIRPLVETRKKDILDWLHNKNIPYRIDRTNFEDKFLRNKIRTRLLPILEEFNPNVVNAIYNLTRLATLDYECIDRLSRDKYNWLKKQRGKGYVKLDLKELKCLHPAMILNILRVVVEELKGNTRRLEAKHLDQILDLIYKKPPLTRIDLPDLEVKREDAWLVIKSLLF
jgi:tRNA(Ile)-lysidine synthase